MKVDLNNVKNGASASEVTYGLRKPKVCVRPSLTGEGSIAHVSRMCHVRGMAKMIQVRNVPQSLHRELKRRAAAADMTLTDYIQRILEREVGRPDWDEWLERIERRPRLKLDPSAAEIIRELRGPLCDGS